jgi:hypothetical protein
MEYHVKESHEVISMINLANIRSVTDFQRNPKGLLGLMKNSGDPVVLTVNGKAEYVLQDAESYQALLTKVQAADDLEAVREGLAQSLAGLGRPAAEFFAEFEKSHGL